MSRGQSGKVVNAGLALSSQYGDQAKQSFSAANNDIAGYNNRLTSFIGANPYKVGGQFAQDQSQISAAGADASSSAVKDNLDRTAMRTGENTAGFASNAAESQRQATRDQTAQMADMDAKRIGADTAYNEKGLDASALPAELRARLYGTSAQESASALNPAAKAAEQPSFTDILGSSFASSLGKSLGAAGTAGGD